MSWIAYKFGMAEHLLSRMLFIGLIVTTLLLVNEKYDAGIKAMLANILLWLLYWTSHRLEKFFHKH